MGIVGATDELRSGECEICKEYRDKLCLDHDHTSGRQRGWLCVGCNTGLGCFKDDPARLDAAKAYLERTK